ncbi:hypothetical protein BGY98DRAFT_932600 [Russula aff. rugulosa BPL654]|nr:hypothetical protein BGY98DRAFT_932600 [Russula aff. rugulosa BPL654]
MALLMFAKDLGWVDSRLQGYMRRLQRHSDYPIFKRMQVHGDGVHPLCMKGASDILKQKCDWASQWGERRSGATRVEKVPIGELEEDNRAPNYAQLMDDREVEHDGLAAISLLTDTVRVNRAQSLRRDSGLGVDEMFFFTRLGDGGSLNKDVDAA